MEKILLFLLVNETCYGAQIQTLLKTPLTPAQKALARLEKGGIVTSRYEGKTRLYQFNPGYPLLAELEMLLKKAYHLLPAQEKRQYCFIHKPLSKESQSKTTELLAFWDQLKLVKKLHFVAKSRQTFNTVHKTGKGEVSITSENSTTLLLQEKGLWQDETAFSNILRWTLDLDAKLISLEHLRYGPSNPVLLFHLTPTKPNLLESVDAHLCGNDTYLGSIQWDRKAIHFRWKILGPKKTEDLTYRYSTQA